MISAPSKIERLPPRLLAVVGGFMLLIVVIFAAAWLINLQRSDDHWVRHTLEVQKSIARVLLMLEDAETGQRGFLLTGDEEYLVPYSRASSTISQELNNLGRLVADSPAQERNLESLRQLTTDKLSELRRVITLRQSGDSDAALALVREGKGKVLMDRARDLVAAMLDIEDKLLSTRVEQTKRTGSILQGAIGLATALAVVSGIAAAYFLRRYLRDVRLAYGALAAANERLEEEALNRDRLESQLRQSQKMEAIGQLTGGVAHDFNNMLAVIIGNLNLIARRVANGQSDITRFIEGATEGANRAAALTHRLLAFSRQQPLAPAAIDANRLVSGMTELLQRTLGEAVRLETVLAGGLWRANADASQLESAILNLAVNARDAMGERGSLTLETANSYLDDAYAAAHAELKAGQYVMIAVTDTGTGMDATTAAKAFDPFFTTKGDSKGTGLGLSQVYGFVKQSGGHVKIYSELGQGTTVKMYLPRAAAATTETERKAPQAPAIPTGGLNEIVLVVEDDDRVRRFTVDALRELNYTVVHADGASNALRLLDAHPGVKLLLTDIVMPDRNGRQLAEEAKRNRADLKVLFFTGFTRNAVVHNGVLDQGVHLLTKPFTMEQLATKVRDVLRS